MADEPAAAPIAAQIPAPEALTRQLDAAAEQAVQAEQTQASTASAGASDVIAALIRNGLSNGPIAQSTATWDHLNTRLPEIVAAIMKEL